MSPEQSSMPADPTVERPQSGAAAQPAGGQPVERAAARVACVGSFDPIHNGHLDIITRASKIFDEVVVLVTHNPNKKTMFTLPEREQLIGDSTAHLGNIVVDHMSGLLVDYCVKAGIGAIVKGLRVATDFDYEIQMSQMNHKIADVETLFLTTNPQHSYISSSLVKEVAKYGGDVRDFLPPPAYDALMARLAEDVAGS